MRITGLSWLLVVFFAGIAAAAPPPQLALLSGVRPIERDTRLMTGDRGPALLLPSEGAYAEAAGLLIRGLAAAGVRSERAESIAAADPAARTVICLGTMLNNPLLERLYWNRYTFADALTPAGQAGPAGQGQYLLQTVYDPYPFNGGHNVIVIGCHDPVGAVRGIKRLLALLQSGRVPYVMEVGPASPVSAAESRRIDATPPEPTLTELSDNANRYLRTGCAAYARKAIAALEIMRKLYAPGGAREGSTPSYYARLPWNEETHSWEIAGAWDAFEECPLLTDGQRLAFSNVLLQFTRDLVGHVSGYEALGHGDTISWNHTTFPLLGIDFGARYFERYYHLPDMPEMLAKARAGFLGQARSWKPKEDADTYMSATMQHTALYCLAENQMGYFTSGRVLRYSDYVVAICDNLGRTAGFGDSNSLATDPRLGDTVLPLALWWSRDGGYRWLMDRYTGGAWRNPYDRGIPATEPDRLTGVQVFPLDPQLYAFTQAHPFYSETATPADVPANEAFDKIAFRQNWDVGGQYFLVDGFARGKHLHYDGNSIVEFVEGGERWLIDHDYYIQNTTEHSMLSILRNGRCDELEPSMSGLAAEADLPGCGYTRTYVRRYNGCDWQRQILWRKGGWLLVADSVTPRTAGEYAFDLTWKTIDSGRDGTNASGDFFSDRGVLPEVTRNCSVVDDPLAPAGRALQLENLTSQVAFGVDLPPGQYSLALVGDGADTNSGNEHGDCLRVSVDGAPTQWFRLTDGKVPIPSPKLILAGPGPHLVLAATTNVHAPMRVQRFIFADAAGKRFVYDALQLPPPPLPDPASARQLSIKPFGPVDSWTSHHHPEGIAVPVAILHQRQAGQFAAGQTTRFASVVYVSRPGARRDLTARRLADNLLAVDGSDPGTALLGRVDTPGLFAEVESGLLTPGSLTLCGLREFRTAGVVLSSSVPIDLEWNLNTGQATVRAPDGGGQITIAIGERRQVLSAASGRNEMTLGVCRLESLPVAPGPVPGEAPPLASGPVEPAAWITAPTQRKVTNLQVADLKDGRGPRLFVATGQSLEAWSSAGDRLWQFTCAGRPNDIAFGKLRPVPGDQILIGSSDTFVYLLSAEGRLLEKRRMHGEPWNRNFGDLPYSVDRVGIWDLDGKGANAIVVALDNSDLQAFDAEWHPLWRAKDCTMQGATQLSFEDLDGTGRPQSIVTADHYGYCEAVDFQGRETYRARNSIGDTVFAVAPNDRGPGKLIVTASSGGDLMGTGTRGWWGAAGGVDMSESKLKPHPTDWRFDNYGYPANRIVAADLTGDGRTEILIASGTGYLYAVDTAGKLLWQDRIGRCVNDVIVCDGGKGGSVICCDESGVVRMTDAGGRVLREWFPPAPGRHLAILPAPGGRLLAVALADGRIAAYRLAP